MQTISRRAGAVVRNNLPPKVSKHFVGIGNYLLGEKEIHLIKYLCDPKKNAIDVGAHHGSYTYWLRRHSHTIAIEPLPEQANYLRLAYSDIEIFETALSDFNGKANLVIPVVNSNLEMQGAGLNRVFDKSTKIEVGVRKLDDLGIQDIGFVKVDVEGHESSVLEGAREIIRADKPVFVIECEDRHRVGALGSVVSILQPMGYGMYSLTKKGLHEVNSVEDANQVATSINYIFIHNSDARTKKAIKSLLP